MKGACVSLENNFGQVFKLTKGLEIDNISKGKLVWDETFSVKTDLLGFDDTVTLRFLRAQPLDMLPHCKIEGSFIDH